MSQVACNHEMQTYRGTVCGVDCDLMGHMSTASFAIVFDSATWHFLRTLGYRWSIDTKQGWADVKNTFEYKRELRVDTSFEVNTRVVRLGQSSVTLVHELRNTMANEVAARAEIVLVSLDRQARKPSLLPHEFRVGAAQYIQGGHLELAAKA